MRKFKFMFIIICIFLGITACSNEKPVPEANVINVIPFDYQTSLQSQQVLAVTRNQPSIRPLNQQTNFQTQNHVIGKNVYVECIVENFTFKKGKGLKQEGEGYIALIVDGKQIEEISTAAFIIKGLKSGSHKIKIELRHINGESYNLSEEFDVTIQ